MPQEYSYLHRALRVALWLTGLILFFRFLFAPLLPFLLALGLSALLEPTVQRLRRAMGVRRSFAAVVTTTAILLSLGGAGVLLALRLGSELLEWSRQLPQAIEAFPALWNSALDRVESWYIACPPFLRTALDKAAAALGENTPALVGKAGSFLMDRISALASALPSVGLFCVTTVLALYFTAVNYSTILSFLKRQLPLAWQERCRGAAQCCRSALLKWLRSELLLLLVTFVIMLLGFWWLKIDYALLGAFFIALVDALPVLGTGTILIPWSLFCFLIGDTGLGLSLLMLYGAAMLVHSLLEPRLLAGQADLPSITVLLAMYLGYHFLGVGGMILLPVLLLLLKQLQDAGVIRLWR